jgi:hypothetical protein
MVACAGQKQVQLKENTILIICMQYSACFMMLSAHSVNHMIMETQAGASMADVCSLCKLGTFSLSAASTCDPCQAGAYSSGSGLLSTF